MTGPNQTGKRKGGKRWDNLSSTMNTNPKQDAEHMLNGAWGEERERCTASHTGAAKREFIEPRKPRLHCLMWTTPIGDQNTDEKGEEKTAFSENLARCQSLDRKWKIALDQLHLKLLNGLCLEKTLYDDLLHFKAVLTGFTITTSKVVYYVVNLSNPACFPYGIEHFF